MLFKPKRVKIKEQLLKKKKISQIINEFEPNLKEVVDDIFTHKSTKEGIPLKLQVDMDIDNDDGYKIIIEENEIIIKAKKSPGAFYGVLLLEEIFEQNEEINLLEIEDYPDLKIRGVMIDISRSKVPKLETLQEMIKLFAKLRYNHIELYVEGFSFEYQSFKELLTENNHISLHDYLEVEKFANKYYMDFVPNQNGFGHMSDWLEKEQYKHLAECPEGFDIWGSHRAPSTLNPLHEESFLLVQKMYGDMLPYTKSKYFNMNFDEPYELGHGFSKDKSDETSVEDVYIDYFNKLATVVKDYGKTPMLWGDVLVKHPEKLSRLPNDVIFIDWGYDKDYPFKEHSKSLKDCNVKYLLAPGTVTWSSITSRKIDMVETITNSANSAKENDGLGIIVTDWGDCGHLQYLPVSYLGFIYGGLISWCDSTIEDATKYLYLMLDDVALLESILELSTYHMLEGEYRSYGSRLFSLILWAEHSKNQIHQVDFFTSKVKANLIEEENVKLINEKFNKVEKLLEKTKKSIISDEIKNSLKLLKILLQINQKMKVVLDNKEVEFDSDIKSLLEYLEEHKRLWFIRNNQFGYPKSANRINWLIEMLTEISRKENL